MARVSSTPLSLFPFCSPRSTCVPRPARPSPTSWRFPIPIAPFRTECQTSMHEKISSNAKTDLAEKLSRTDKVEKVKKKEIKLFFFIADTFFVPWCNFHNTWKNARHCALMTLITVISLNVRCQGNVYELLMPIWAKKCPLHGLAHIVSWESV